MQPYKTQQCKFYKSTGCSKGASCTFRHDGKPGYVAKEASTAVGGGIGAFDMIPAMSGLMLSDSVHPALSAGAAFGALDEAALKARGFVTMHSSTQTNHAMETNRVTVGGDQHVDVHAYIDRSGSMHGSSLLAAKTALKELYDSLEAKDGISLYSFNDTLLCLRSIETKRNIPDYHALVDLMSASGGTDLMKALTAGVSHMAASLEWFKRKGTSPRKQHMILLTDGECDIPAADLRKLLSQLPAMDARLWIIAVASAVGQPSIKVMGGMKNVKVENACDAGSIAGAFRSIREAIRSLVCTTTYTITHYVNPATGATLSLKSQKTDVRPLEFEGAPGGAGALPAPRVLRALPAPAPVAAAPASSGGGGAGGSGQAYPHFDATTLKWTAPHKVHPSEKDWIQKVVLKWFAARVDRLTSADQKASVVVRELPDVLAAAITGGRIKLPPAMASHINFKF